MSVIRRGIDVNAPRDRVYEEWTRFEEFPRFMKGVQEVRQIDPTTMHWRAKLGGREQEWDAVVTAAEEGSRLAWSAPNGPHDVTLTFTVRRGRPNSRRDTRGLSSGRHHREGGRRR
jgi:uncharacterized membrane protein